MAYKISSSTFSISSPVVIKNGTEGYGKILTTDASGLTVWKEPKSFFGTSRYIGELYGGGIVVDYWKEGDVENTLIMSLTHLSYDYVWSNVPSTSYDSIVGTPYDTQSNSFYDGRYNSNLITSQIVYDINFGNVLATHTMSSAKMCLDYNYGGYDDWYLPSYNEFNSIIKNKHIINRVLGEVDGIRSQNTGSGSALNGLYWTSTEYVESYTTPPNPLSTIINTPYALQYSTSEGKFKNASKTSSAMVRAVRREQNITGNGLVLSLDAGNKNSYDDSTRGNVWYDLVNKGITASAGLTFSASATGVTYSATNSGYISFQNNKTSYIDFNVNLDNTPVVTIEMFARLKNNSGNIFSWGGSGYSFSGNGSGFFGFWTGGGDLYGITSQRSSDYSILNNWKHYIIVMRTDVSYTNNKIYINGDNLILQSYGSGTEHLDKNFSNGYCRINSDSGGGFSGSGGLGMDLAVFNIYKRELNKTEIVNNFNKYKKRFEIKDTPYQKDIILNVNSNITNSFDPISYPNLWSDQRLFSDLTLNPPKNLVFTSTPTYTKSSGVYPGTYINFNGSNKASVANSIAFTYSTTWECWVKFEAPQPIVGPNMFMGQGLPYFSFATQYSKIVFSNSFSGVSGTVNQMYQFSNTSPTYSIWYHLAFTTKYDPVTNTTSSKIYINGNPDYSNTITTNGVTTYDSNYIPGYQLNNYPLNKFTIGDGSDVNPNNQTPQYWYPFNGSLAEVRIYNRTLSSVEIKNNYNSSKHLYNIDQNHYTHNLNTSPTFSIFQNLTLDFPNKQNNSILVSDSKGLVSLSTPNSILTTKVKKRSVGDLYAGGIIVSVFDYQSTTNYLVASLADLSTTYYWSTLAGSQSMSILGCNEFNGSYNTGLIKNSFGSGSYAAMTASVYNYGGYTDWYLPSSNELREAYNNSNIINLVLGKNTLTDTYWSSTESAFGVQQGGPYSIYYNNSFAFNFGSQYASIPSNISGLGVNGATASGLEFSVGKYNQFKVRPFRLQKEANYNLVTDGLIIWLDAGVSDLSWSGSGTGWYDITSNNNNGVFYTGLTAAQPTYLPQNMGGFSFNGTNQKVIIHNSPSLLAISNAVTVEVWVKPSVIDTDREIFSKNSNQGYRMRLDSTGHLWMLGGKATSSFDTYTSTGTTTANKWVQLVAVWTSSGYYTYMNGVSSGFDLTKTFSIQVNTLQLELGVFTGGAEWFNGVQSVFRVYNRALTSSEVNYNFNAQRNRFGL